MRAHEDILSLRWSRLLPVLISMLSVTSVMAQSATGTGADTVKSNIVGPLDFKGTVEELGKTIKGAIVTVYESADGSRDNLKEIKKIVTPGNGSFAIKFEINKLYLITVQKEGYTTKGIDVDTDVRLARSYYTKVPPFEFKVDMVKDVDGLAFKKSVANVFYQIKRNAFDYELDYSKEEMEEEERLLREQEEKRKLAELAAQKKFEMEEAAKLLREQEGASMEEKIKAAITVGNENRPKTIQALTEIFPVNDTLRSQKANAIYDALGKERLKDGKTKADINYRNLFAVAQTLEQEVAEKAEKQQQKQNEELRAAREDAERKKEVAMAVQQQALELEMREKIAAANLKAEEDRRKAEKEKQDNIYYAIFNSGGDRKSAISNIAKTYGKADPYAERKAEAIYAEYENMRLTGTTLAKMDFGKLFAAADFAEQQAVKEEIERADAKERTKTEAYLKKEQEQKEQIQRKAADVILNNLKAAPQDEKSQVDAFVRSFPANDPFRQQKGQAMYDEYVVQQNKVKKTGNVNAPLDFGAMFAAAEVAEKNAKEQESIRNFKEKEAEQIRREELREAARQEKMALGEQAAKQAREVHVAKMNEAKNKREREIGQALEAGGGDRDRTVNAIMQTFPKGTENAELKAEAMFDAYVQESARMKVTGGAGAKLDYSALFKAAEQAELLALERQYQEKQAVEQEQLLAYEEKRVEVTKQVLQEKAQEATQELARAEAKYEETSKKVDEERSQRILAEQKIKEEAERELAMEQAKRMAEEKEKEAQVLAKLEAERKARLSTEQAEQERIAAAKLAEQQKAEAAAKAAAEQERQLALAAEKKAEEERQKEEARIRAAEAAAKAEAAKLAAMEEAERVKEEQRLLAEAEKARVAAEKAAAEAARQEEERRRQEELAAAEEAKRIEEQRKRDRDAEIAGILASAKQASQKGDHQSAAAAYRELLALDSGNSEAKAGLKASEDAIAAIAKAEAERKALDEQYARLIAEGDAEMDKGNLKAARNSFNKARELKPQDLAAQQRLADADTREKEIAAAEEQRAQTERQYIMLMQEGSRAMGASNLALAKTRFTEASALKPDEQEPKAKLNQIAEAEKELALQAEQKKQREEEAKRKFEEQQKKQKEEELARLDAMSKADAEKASKESADLSSEEKRAKEFDRIKENVEKLNLNAEDQRKAFLSELAKLYPAGVTEETVEAKNYRILRHVINENDVVTVYEQRTWDWGGVFWFKNGDINITESLYKLELSRVEK